MFLSNTLIVINLKNLISQMLYFNFKILQILIDILDCSNFAL
jgi:hypothetical protein